MINESSKWFKGNQCTLNIRKPWFAAAKYQDFRIEPSIQTVADWMSHDLLGPRHPQASAQSHPIERSSYHGFQASRSPKMAGRKAIFQQAQVRSWKWNDRGAPTKKHNTCSIWFNIALLMKFSVGVRCSSFLRDAYRLSPLQIQHGTASQMNFIQCRSWS